MVKSAIKKTFFFFLSASIYELGEEVVKCWNESINPYSPNIHLYATELPSKCLVYLNNKIGLSHTPIGLSYWSLQVLQEVSFEYRKPAIVQDDPNKRIMQGIRGKASFGTSQKIHFRKKILFLIKKKKMLLDWKLF